MWSHADVCLQSPGNELAEAASRVYSRTCRTSLDEPGFCALNLGPAIGSRRLRQWMVDLKQALALIHAGVRGQTLAFLSAARFDQQVTTKFHLDGGPAECFLMLGYEPTEVDSELQIADYAKAAHAVGLSPKEFLARHNPMFQAGLEMIQPYVTTIPCFSQTDYQIVCVNNSWAAMDGQSWQGTLHAAKIVNANESKRRIINSALIAGVPLDSADGLPELELQDFVTSDFVHRRGYDKTTLEDDH